MSADIVTKYYHIKNEQYLNRFKSNCIIGNLVSGYIFTIPTQIYQMRANVKLPKHLAKYFLLGSVPMAVLPDNIIKNDLFKTVYYSLPYGIYHMKYFHRHTKYPFMLAVFFNYIINEQNKIIESKTTGV